MIGRRRMGTSVGHRLPPCSSADYWGWWLPHPLRNVHRQYHRSRDCVSNGDFCSYGVRHSQAEIRRWSVSERSDCVISKGGQSFCEIVSSDGAWPSSLLQRWYPKPQCTVKWSFRQCRAEAVRRCKFRRVSWLLSGFIVSRRCIEQNSSVLGGRVHHRTSVSTMFGGSRWA
ncbi:hypothetical protein R1flu_024715 [Riccia fluitans]|uniref:Uncharacterized protein n=1 Tax=Riccia fluitans TaxID=41844 RepID=A0ABD1XWN2_9MARC